MMVTGPGVSPTEQSEDIGSHGLPAPGRLAPRRCTAPLLKSPQEVLTLPYGSAAC